jgi:hypothetical protein
MMIIKGLCRQFFGKTEKTQIMYINSVEKLHSINLNKKLDNFQNNQFCSKIFPKIIILENFDSFGNLAQLGMRERMEQKIRKTKFWVTANFFSKINQTILSRCLKLFLNFIFPNLILLRWVEILNKKNKLFSLEYLQICLNLFHRKIVKQSKIISQICIKRITVFLERQFFQYIKCIIMTSFNNSIKEEKLVVFRKNKNILNPSIFLQFKILKNLKKNLYCVFPLIDF